MLSDLGDGGGNDDSWDTASWDTGDWDDEGWEEGGRRGVGCSSVSTVAIPWSIAGLGLLFLMGRRRSQRQG